MTDPSQTSFREDLFTIFQGNDPLAADSIVIGYGLVIELLGPDGERAVHKITSDPSGKELPWYQCETYGKVLSDCTEFDEDEDEDD